MEYRKLSSYEQDLLLHLLNTEFPGHMDLLSMLPNLEAKNIDENGSLELKCFANTKANIIKRVPVEAEALDTDEIIIHVLLHVIDGVPAELEFYKEDGSLIIKHPPVTEYKTLVLPPAPPFPNWRQPQ